jgi:hypothetical protein
MERKYEIGVFKPTNSRADTKIDTTTRIAREIIDHTNAARMAKTERLRAVRLAREAEAEAPPEKPAPKKPAPRKARGKK